MEAKMSQPIDHHRLADGGASAMSE